MNDITIKKEIFNDSGAVIEISFKQNNTNISTVQRYMEKFIEQCRKKIESREEVKV